MVLALQVSSDSSSEDGGSVVIVRRESKLETPEPKKEEVGVVKPVELSKTEQPFCRQESEDSVKPETQDEGSVVIVRRVKKLVYLVRHGQALHNVLEDEAKKSAAADAEESGIAKGSPEYDRLVKGARTAVLHDIALMDAELTEVGKAQALDAKMQIQELASGAWNLPQPTGVLVSPLQRALQTADVMFPGHPNVRVHDVLRERVTGFPCDTPSPVMGCRIKKKKSFSLMDFADSPSHDLLPPLDDEKESPRTPSTVGTPCAEFELEDAFKLRQRTAQLAEVLRKTEDQVICVVTHKGFLREIERGPFGQVAATEFGNAEVRAYEVSLGCDGSMEASLVYQRGSWECRGI